MNIFSSSIKENINCSLIYLAVICLYICLPTSLGNFYYISGKGVEKGKGRGEFLPPHVSTMQ